MVRSNWQWAVRLFLFFAGLIWLIGLFLPKQTHASFFLNSSLTAEKIYTTLTDTGTLSYLVTGRSVQSEGEKLKFRSANSCRITQSYPYQYLAFEWFPGETSIQQLEGEIQLSPDESGIKVELRCRLSLENTPIDKWNFWLKRWQFEERMDQIKTRLQAKMPN